MPFVSITRLRVRSVRFLPRFALYTHRSVLQVRKAAGYLGGGLLADRRWTFWTMTTWNSQEDMRRYMLSGAHRSAMPKLLNWCDEASVTHWDQPQSALPSWSEADRRMRSSGRISKVHHPNPDHASLNYRAPRVTSGKEIRPKRVPLRHIVSTEERAVSSGTRESGMAWTTVVMAIGTICVAGLIRHYVQGTGSSSERDRGGSPA